MKTVEDMAREAGFKLNESGYIGDGFDSFEEEVRKLAALVRAQALDEAAAVARGFVWFEVEGCDPDGAPPFIADRILSLKDRTNDRT